jgi:protein-disulfide isomerase
MASTEKTKKTPPPAPAKQSVKERRAAQKEKQKQQQQLLMGIVAVTFLVVVLFVIFLAVQPVEALIPDDAVSKYQEFHDKNMISQTEEGFPVLGDPKAPVLLEEIASFACIVCKNYHDSTVSNILDEIKAGRVKMVFIPVTTTGEFKPRPATEAALCADKQGKFWEYGEILYDWQTRYGGNTNDTRRLTSAANKLGLDMGAFNSCLSSKEVKDIIDRGEKVASDRRMSGTPTVFLDGVQLQPPLNNVPVPSLSELRGLIETKAAAAQPKSN